MDRWLPWLLVLGFALCDVGNAQAEVLFQWAAKGGVRFQFSKSGMNSLVYPPDFNEDRMGGNLLLGVIGILYIESYLEFNFDVDLGELFVGHLKRGKSQGVAVLLNDYKLNLSAEEGLSLQQQLEFCKVQARRQGLPESECLDPSVVLLESLFLREMYASISFQSKQWAKLDIGLMRRVIGRAFVMDQFVLGLHLDLDWSKRKAEERIPFRLEFDFFLPDATFTPEGKQSPTFHLRTSYVFSEEYSVSFFATYLYDGNNLAGKNLLTLWKELLPSFLNNYLAAQTGSRTSFSCTSNPTEEDLRLLRNAYPKSTQQQAEDYILGYLEDACNKLPSSSGHHVWLGLEGEWRWRNKVTFAGTLIWYLSSMTIGLPKGLKNFDRQQGFQGSRERVQEENTIDVPVQKAQFAGIGFLGEVSAMYHWTPTISGKLFFLLATGDTVRQQKSSLFAFMGIAPQVRYTDVFFNGGVNSYSSRRGIGVSGISGHGYLAPGMNLRYEKEGFASLQLTGAAFWSIVPSPFASQEQKTSGQFYGFEINMIGSFYATKWLKPVAQVDFFVPGNFFAPSLSPTVMFQVLVGLDFIWI